MTATPTLTLYDCSTAPSPRRARIVLAAKLVRVVARPSLRPFTAYAREASPAGLSFLHDCPLGVGTGLAIQLATGPRGVSRVRSARVVHVSEADGLWLIGCMVSPPFSAAELEGLR